MSDKLGRSSQERQVREIVARETSREIIARETIKGDCHTSDKVG
jgi:hypothetical protein